MVQLRDAAVRSRIAGSGYSLIGNKMEPVLKITSVLASSALQPWSDLGRARV